MVSVFLFSLVANEMVFENETIFDSRAFSLLASYTTPFNTKTAILITWFGTGYFLLPAYLLITLYHNQQNKNKEAILVLIFAFVSMMSGMALKVLFHRTRPMFPLISGAGGYSFPSGHSLGGFTFSGVLIYLLLKTTLNPYLKWIFSILLIIFSLLIGLSRIYLRVHFASDVLGSLLLTIVWLSITFILFETIEKRSHPQ